MVYYSHDPAVIVFDDLGKDNYEMIYKPFNFDELQLVIEKLAKFHALSLVLEEQVSVCSYVNIEYVIEQSNTFKGPCYSKVRQPIRISASEESVRELYERFAIVCSGSTKMAWIRENWRGFVDSAWSSDGKIQ